MYYFREVITPMHKFINSIVTQTFELGYKDAVGESTSLE